MENTRFKVSQYACAVLLIVSDITANPQYYNYNIALRK